MAEFDFMVTREINSLEIDIDEHKANEIYFTEDFISSISEFDSDIETIKKEIYAWNNNDSFFPLSILWEITNICNFECPFCYVNTKKAKRHKYESFEEIKIKIDQLLDLGMLFCTLSGGECLTHPCFIDIYKYLKQSGVIVSVFTNGMLINEEILELFGQYKPYKVEISIYGITEETFMNVTGASNCKKVLTNIEKLKNLDIWVRCKTPITKITSKEIPKIKEWCKKNLIDFYVSDELFDSYYGESVNEYRTYDNVYKKAIESKERALKKNSNNEYDYKRAWDCSAGKYAGVLAADGYYYPCMSSIGLSRYRFDIRGGIGQAILEYKKVLSKEKNRKLQFCRGCNHCDVCDKCIISYYKETRKKLMFNCKHMCKI